ncbi:MAG: YegJ family protein [bacterium]
MARVAYISFLIIGILIIIMVGCSNQDKTISVADDDQEMNNAIAKARETLPQFWQRFDNPESGDSDFSIKLRITDKDEVEHFWMTDIERKDGQIYGKVSNEPDTITNVKLGDRLQIPEKDISDWYYMHNGKMVGNYTLRVLLKHMSAKEAQQYKSLLAD